MHEAVYAPTMTSAVRFAECGRLEEWVHEYLRSDGNNVPFSDGLKLAPRRYFGPVAMPLSMLKRCCGPEKDMKFRVEREGFERHVSELMRAAESGGDMPPLIANFTSSGFVLNDGNHRFEAYQRLGLKQCNVIIWTTGMADAELLARRHCDILGIKNS